MIKKILLSLCAVFPALAAANAQSVGNWNVLAVYSGVPQRMAETPKLVYYLSKGHLYSYNKQTDETLHYSTVNKLNDVHVQDIAYNPFRGYLVIVYDTSNIDLLYDNGRVVNLPDIRDASISADKSVGAVNFSSDGRIYVATGFGFVAFDDTRHRVADSGIYNKSMDFAAEIDGHLVLAAEGTIYASPVDARHNSLNSFTQLGTLEGSDHSFCPLGDKFLLMRSGVPSFSSCTYSLLVPDFAANTVSAQKIDSGILRMDFTPFADGRVRMAHGTVSRLFGTDGTSSVEYILPEPVIGKSITTLQGDGDVWVADNSGVAHYSIEGSGLTLLSGPAKPESLTCYWPAFMSLSPDGDRIYVSNCGNDAYRNEVAGYGFAVEQTTNIIERDGLRDVTCYNADNTGSVMNGGTTVVAESPFDPSVYFISNYRKGVYVIKDGEQIARFDNTNLPFVEEWATRVRDLKFDRDNNLWLCAWPYKHEPIFILPAEKVRTPETVTSADWLTVNVGSYSNSDGIVSLHHSRSNYALFGACHNAMNFLVLDHKGTLTDVSDDTPHVFTHFVDQDGNEIKIDRVFSLMEDSDGCIWIGAQTGIYHIPDIKNALKNGSLHVRRPKVPRNDGTNFADYLLADIYAFDISEDPAGRKWIATNTSGLYLVNRDGTSIIEHFTNENSPLPSDKVFTVKADPHGSNVYIGTDKGVVSYTSDAAPGAEDYSDVYAYPNPVRPDHLGWITVTGLMDNSLVKITDSAGNLVCQGTSEGGIYLWNGCNSANQRVRSGVYFVFASQNASGAASGKPVTKILVIN